MKKRLSHSKQEDVENSFDTPFDAPQDSPTLPLDFPPAPFIEDPVIRNIGSQRKLAWGSRGTQMTWPTERSGNVTISGRIPIWDRDRNEATWLLCTLVVAKQKLIHFLEASQKEEQQEDQQGTMNVGMWKLPAWCALVLWQAAKQTIPKSKRPLSLPLNSPYEDFRMRLRREDIGVLSQFFTVGGPNRSEDWGEEFANTVRTSFPALWKKYHVLGSSPPWLHLCDLALSLHIFLFDSRVLRLVLYPPRGRAAARSIPTRRIEATLTVYRSLLRLRSKQGRIQTALDDMLRIVKFNPQISAYLEHFANAPDAIAVALSHHWLQERAQGIKLLGSSPQWTPPRSIFRRYLFNKGQEKQHIQLIERTRRIGSSIDDQLIEAWIGEYLLP